MAIEFTVDHDHTYAGEEGVEPLIGWITFSVSTYPGDFRVREQGANGIRTMNLPPRRGWLAADGHLYKDQTLEQPCRLVANDPAFNLLHLTYRADFELTTVLGEPVAVPLTYFPAPSTDTTLYLTKVLADPSQRVMEVRTTGYLEDILDLSAIGSDVLHSGTAEQMRDVIGAVGRDEFAFNVRDYGAIGDGVVEDTAAIQAAIDAASVVVESHNTANYQIGGTVLFPPGVYRIENVTVPEHLTLEGHGATLKSISGTTGYLLTFTTGMYGGMNRLTVIADNQTDALGGVHVNSDRTRISITDCVIDLFRGRGVLVEGGQAVMTGNFINALYGDQTALSTQTGALEINGAADAIVVGNEVSGHRWHPDPIYSTDPTVARNMYCCAIAVINAGTGRFTDNIAELAETGWFIKDSLQIHMSGNRGEFSWGHGYWFVNSSGRIEGCWSFENSKVESGVFDGFHFGNGDAADNGSNFQVSNCTSRSNMGVFSSTAAHRWGVFDISYNPIYGNSYSNFRSYDDVGVFSDASATRPYYGGGPQFSIPQANSAYYLSGATPSVAGKTMFRCSGSTTITNFLGAVPGQIFYVLGTGSVTVANSADVVMGSGADTVLANGKWYQFMFHDGAIRELALSSRNIRTITGSVTLGSSVDSVVFIGAGGAPTLPTAVDNSCRYTIKNVDSTSKSIATTSSQTIEGLAAPYTLAPNASVDLVSDGSNWRIV